MKSRYTINEKISTVFIDKEFVEKIESYLKIKIPKLLGIETLDESLKTQSGLLNTSLNDLVENMKKNYEITIFDTLGEEIIYTIHDYQGKQFSNGVNRLLVNYKLIDDKNDSSIIVAISFGKKEKESEIQIKVEGKNAKENGVGIYNVIKKLIHDNKTNNHLIYPNGLVDFLIVVIGFSSFIMLLNDEWKLAYRIIGGFGLILTIFYKQILPKFKPYCEFDTKRQQEHNRVIFWMITSLIGFSIFGVLFIWMRKEIFGF